MNRRVVAGCFLGWFGLLLAACQSENRADVVIPPVPAEGFSPRPEVALQALNDAIVLNPSGAENYFQRARLLREQGKREQALADIDRAIDLRTNEGSFFLLKAQLLRETGRPKEALDRALRAGLLRASTPELDVLLGDLYQQQGEFKKARQYLDQALRAAPFDGTAHYTKGILLTRLADTSQALASFRRALQLDPRLPEAYEQLARLYTQRGDYNRALQASETGLRRYPANGTLHYLRGLGYHRLGKTDSATVAYRRALRLVPNLAEAQVQMGLLLMKYRNYEGALTYLEPAYRTDARLPRLALALGQCLEYTGQTARAQALYAQALRAAPNDAQAAAGYARVQRRVAGYGSFRRGDSLR